MLTFDTSVLGGLPVTIQYTYQDAEPDVGLSAGVEDVKIIAVYNEPCDSCPAWLEIMLDDYDVWDSIGEKCLENWRGEHGLD